MIVALGQIAGLGIRDKTARMWAWVGGNGVVALATFAVSIAAGLLTYLALLSFTLWRLTGRR